MSLAAYSSWKHLGDVLFVGPDTYMAAVTPLAMYADGSGTKRDALLVVGGFIASVEQWKVFDVEWNLVLREAGVSYFHMKEFAHSTGEFKDGWKGNEDKRAAFLDRLIAVIAQRAEFSLSTCVRKDIYDQVDTIYKLHEELWPYPLAGITCVDQANQWKERRHEEDPIEYIFASGDDDHGQLMNAVKKLTGQDAIFRSAKEATPLQAADFAAYEQYRANRSTDVELDRLFIRFRAPLWRLAKSVPGWHGTYDDVTNLRTVCRHMNIQKRGGEVAPAEGT